MDSDPITATPPSQRKCQDDGMPSRPAALQHKAALLEERSKKDAVDKMPGHVPSASLRTKPVQTPTASSKGSEPPIHAALKRSSALSANDNTEICIDITGDQEEIEQEGLIGGSSDGTGSNAAVPARFASLAPFLHASEKWFSNFDPNLQQLLATRAQQLAIHSQHFSSFNAAFYILSKGPWIPTHISVHVRQAALAAVGVGWSWVNQVPTAFPLINFDASVSLATLEDVPTNQVAQVEAVFAIYATLCGNLSHNTRAFLFTKYEVQCSVCMRHLKVPIDLFLATVSSSTTMEELLRRMTPVWNMAEIKDRQECLCLELEKASSRCIKLGPVVFIRLKAEQGETLPRIETGHLPLGHQFSFQTRTYEIRCLVTTNRIDQDSQLLIIQAGQSGMVTTYDHNNGLRVLDSSRVNSKLLITGVLVLPVKSPKAILTTKDLITVAGAVDTACYNKKQLKVVKGILKSPKEKRNLSSQTSRKNGSKKKSHSNERKAMSSKPKRSHGECEHDSLSAIDPEGLPMTILGDADPAKVGIISMFDGVGSVYHIIKKKLGKPPAVYIAAEYDPVLRRLVSAEIGLREDQQWGYNVEGVATLYVKDVWDLLDKKLLILRQAKAMYPEIKWILIAGSPCQDLTFAGYLNGLLGLTGKRSMLFL